MWNIFGLFSGFYSSDCPSWFPDEVQDSGSHPHRQWKMQIESAIHWPMNFWPEWIVFRIVLNRSKVEFRMSSAPESKKKNQSDNSLKSKYPAEMECSGFFSSDRNRIPNECGIPDLIRTGIQKFRINKTLPANIPPSLIFGNFVSCFYPIDAEFRMVAEFRMSTEFRMDLIRQGFSFLFF